jgi:esterase/lipase
MSDRLARAQARIDAIVASERADARIDPTEYTRAWLTADVAPRAVVLLHGLTNGPRQYERLAPLIAARGWSVIAPRFPYHGFSDRMSTDLGRITFEDFAAAALEAVAIAALSAERVTVAGISIGSTIGGWIAGRVAIDHVLAISPFCGIHSLPGVTNDWFADLLRTVPNAELWWDPRSKERQKPDHAYPRFATRSLGVSLQFGTDMANVDPGGPHARAVTLALNTHDPAVNNAHAERRFAKLRELGVGVRVEKWHSLPEIHDIIEPEIPEARTDLSYPLIIDALTRA